MKLPIYLDYSATTPVDPRVAEKMMQFMTMDGTFGNPASRSHRFGWQAEEAVDIARNQIADLVGADPREIVFTSGATESDNLAIKGAANFYQKKGKHIITSQIEHHAVLHTCQYMEKQGYEVTYLPVDENGLVSVEDVKNAIRPDTVLISIMAANNEIGTIEPIREIGKVAHEAGVLFHTDAVQAVGAVPIDVNDWNVDMLSLSGHKFHAPKGIGALYIRKGVKISNLIFGGAQERGLRAGTENLPGIVGLGAAIELAVAELPEYTRRLTALRDRLIDGILKNIPDVRLNGHRTQRLPGNVNVSVRYVEGEALLMRLDLAGVEASSGSACTSGSLDPSHVLLAIGLPHEIAHGSLRLSLGNDTTEADVDYVIEKLPGIVRDLREMSALSAQNSFQP